MATYGPELILNGTFDTDLSNWYQSPDIGKWEWNAGRAHQLYAQNDEVIFGQQLADPLVANELYEFTISFEYVLSQNDSGVLYCYLRTASGTTIATFGAFGIGETGTYTGQFRTPYMWDIRKIEFAQSGARNFECYIDDISLRQVTPAPTNPNLPAICTGTVSVGGGGGGDGYDEDENIICLTADTSWDDGQCLTDAIDAWTEDCP